MLKKLAIRGALILFGLLVVLVFGVLGWRMMRQYQISDAMAIRSPNGIDERRYVRIGGVEQWITIRGQNRSNPAILMLHGGPGAALSAAPAHFLAWEKEFTVVQWDQRGAGKSYASKQPVPSIEGMVQDALEVSEYARKRLHRQKIILLGHSWGSVLGVRLVKAHPDSFDVYVGTGQIVNAQKNEVIAYANVLAKARAPTDRNAIDALEKSGAPPYRDIRQMGTQRRWAIQYEPGRPVTGPQGLLVELLTAPEYSFKEIVNFVRGEIDGDDYYGQTLDGPVPQIDLVALGTDFTVPFFVVEGEEDDITPASLAKSYFEQVTAPRKAFILLPSAGHMALPGLR